MTVKNYVLDINKTSLQHPSIVLRQDDYNIYTVNISVTENGVPVNLGSYTLNFLGITPAGAKIIDSKNFITNSGDLKNGKFSYRFPKEAAGSKGVYDVAYFRLKTTSGATSTIDLNLRVLGGIDVTADEVKDYITVDDILLNTLTAEVFKKVDAKVDEHLATVKKGDTGPQGPKGDTGPQGPKGDAGDIRMRNGSIITNDPFNINTETWNLEFDDTYTAVTDAYTQYRINVATFALPDDAGFLWYNTTDEVFVTTSKASEALDSFVYLGRYFKNSKTFTISGDYLVDGYKIATTKELPLLVYPAQLLSTKKVIVDRVEQKLIFEDGQAIAVQVGNQRFKPKVVGTEMDLSENKANYLFFDSVNNKIITQTSYISSSNDLAYLGYINFGNNFAIDLNANYMVKDYSVAAKYAGQSFAALGDSTVNGDNGQGKTSNSWSWVAYISYLCGFSDVDNVGVNGSRVTKGTSRDDSLVERYDQIKDKDFVAVMAGVNDFINNMTLGEINTIGSKFDITTFYGAYQTVVEGLKKNNPNAKLLLITSMKVNNDRANSFVENSIGLKQKDYINAIKEIGEMYGIRVHSLYDYAGFSPFLESDSIYTVDKLHPTELGYKVLASQIAGTINAM